MRPFSFTREFLFATVVVALVVSGFLRLGLWQLDRARQKHEVFERYSANVAQAETRLADLLEMPLSESMWRRVHATGIYRQGVDILLDNQSHAGQPGYLVYTPMQLTAESAATVLVNRGWIPNDGHRQAISLPKLDRREIRIAAVIGRAPVPGMRIPGDESIEQLGNGVWRAQVIEYAALNRTLKLELRPFVLLLDPHAAGGFVRDWPAPGSDEARHKSYAVQWFAMAAALVVIYIVLLARSRR